MDHLLIKDLEVIDQGTEEEMKVLKSKILNSYKKDCKLAVVKIIDHGSVNHYYSSDL